MIPARGVAREALRNNPDVVMWVAGIFVPALAFEIRAIRVSPQKMLSHGYARAAKRHPKLTHGFLTLTVLHLLDGCTEKTILPVWADPFRGFGFIHPRELLGKS